MNAKLTKKEISEFHFQKQLLLFEKKEIEKEIDKINSKINKNYKHSYEFSNQLANNPILRKYIEEENETRY